MRARRSKGAGSRARWRTARGRHDTTGRPARIGYADAVMVAATSGWALSIVLWTSAAIGPAPAADAGTAAEPAAEDPQLEEARKLYAEGEARFDTADFDKAFELWTRAFTIVPDSPDAGRIKALLIYNIATARERSYEVTGDVSHLRHAKILMEG